ncbi:beta/alpha barrel domain-containing protein [Pseudocnuella soli]|uniref:bifunctional 4-hydroxy-2-oxoglutarate aldolase/2-dehydro-3-deoxy-phosphogluconate aldolase n=1 Tax=Pseudocnuella soli TaxID=2502779 RepID=UPI001044DA0C|nr:bifunctional 4-hydroxy-2-oxoglutarate aldolase/2-dehydro-3-deoxy-phosphogluconate aldolase [Pseudocnuella soli]
MPVNKATALDALLQQKLLPLFYHDDADVCCNVMQALYNGGVRLFEFTNRGANALANFRLMKEQAAQQMPDLMLGIGTIKNVAAANAFMDAGADFIVCPTINAEVAKVVHANGMLWVPGCMTPTEIAAAEEAGATLVKVFPGNILGPGYISAVKELFPDLRLMPTGGTEPEATNLQAWFGSGVAAVGMGSKLITAAMLRDRDYAAIETAARSVLQLIAQASGSANAAS